MSRYEDAIKYFKKNAYAYADEIETAKEVGLEGAELTYREYKKYNEIAILAVNVLDRLERGDLSQFAENEIRKAISADGAKDVYLDDVQRGIKETYKQLIQEEENNNEQD